MLKVQQASNMLAATTSCNPSNNSNSVIATSLPPPPSLVCWCGGGAVAALSDGKLSLHQLTCTLTRGAQAGRQAPAHVRPMGRI